MSTSLPRNAAGTAAVGADGRYRLGARLGSGGMADVYRGTDLLLDRPVAVKVLRDATPTEVPRPDETAQVSAELDPMGRFQVEARTLAGLDHPNLVTLLDAGTSRSDGLDRPYLVMELVEGPTLKEAVRRSDGMTPAEVARIGLQVGAGLAHCHEAGVVHRDVKPGNILLSGVDGAAGGPEALRARLADFGIARLLDGAAHLTRTGFTIGTAAYLAPEQVRGHAVTPATDVYSLGLVLLEALTGEAAYTGAPMEVAAARLHRAPGVPTSLPAGWQPLIAAMTSLDPADRPSADEVADRLRRTTPDGVVPPASVVDPAETAAMSVEPDGTTLLPVEPVETLVLAPLRRSSPLPWSSLARPRLRAGVGATAAAALAFALILAVVVATRGGPKPTAPVTRPTPATSSTPQSSPSARPSSAAPTAAPAVQQSTKPVSKAGTKTGNSGKVKHGKGKGKKH